MLKPIYGYTPFDHLHEQIGLAKYENNIFQKKYENNMINQVTQLVLSWNAMLTKLVS